jgi:NADPH:quinone reductase-like Zn-dependent oxidoreductase
MKVVKCTKYGPPDVLHLCDADKPIPRDNEVLIKVYNTAVTIGDSRIRGFKVPLSFWIPAKLFLGIRKPKKSVLGSIFAGEIEAVGKNTNKFKIGDKVFGSNGHNFATYAEFICIAEDGCLNKTPKKLSYIEATAILWGGLTALHFLKKANIQKGQKVLIYGASGSVGTSAIQIAKYFGAEVTGVCSTVNIDMVKSLGANHVIDYTKSDFTNNRNYYDIVFDTVGKTIISKAIISLKPNGQYIHAVTTPALEIKIRINLFNSNKTFIGGTFTPNIKLINFVSKLAENGNLKPVIDRIYPLEEIVEAHRYVDKGHKKGNVIITITHKNMDLY